MTQEREQIVAVLRDAGLPTEGPYVDDAVETWRSQLASGKEPWPLEIFVKLAEHRQAGADGDHDRQRELEREIWHLQGHEGDPWLSDEERAAARKAVRSVLKESR